jgi:ribosome-associated protein
MPIPVNNGLELPDTELTWRFSPSGGPGGQHANRSHTRVELTWSIAGSAVLSDGQRRRLLARLGPVVTVSADDERSQTRNRDVAERRLADRVRDALKIEKPRRKTKPSKGSQERRLRAKRSRSQDKRLRQRPKHDD